MRRRTIIMTLALALAVPLGARAAEPAVAGGMRAYVDPATGRDVPTPPSAPDESTEAQAGRRAAPESPHTGDPIPPAVPNPGPGGGGMIDVGGRLQSDVTATLEPNGDVRVRCLRPGGSEH